MNTLVDINTDAITVDGLQFEFGTRPHGAPNLIAKNEHGAIELWQMQGIGGVEIHSPKPLGNGDDNDGNDSCYVLDTPCWHDGSSLEYVEKFAPLLNAGDSAAILRLLADWHRTELGGAA